MNNSHKKTDEWLLTLPSLFWLTTFFVIPSLIIVFYAFKPQNDFGGIESGWSLDAIESLFNKNYLILTLRTILISGITTMICTLLALPVGYYMATVQTPYRHLLILLLLLPFWTSFLIRIFAWKTLLHPENYLSYILVTLKIISPQGSLLYSLGAVLFVTVYTYLPFAIFPVYAASAKFNFNLIEAAMDLGATRAQAFRKVFIPGISQGISTAALMVFISTAGAYIIPDLIGGFNSEMIGSTLAQRVFVDKDLPQASALSLLLSAVVLLPLLIAKLVFFPSTKMNIELKDRE